MRGGHSRRVCTNFQRSRRLSNVRKGTWFGDQPVKKVGIPDVEGFLLVGFEVFGDVGFDEGVELLFLELFWEVYDRCEVTFKEKFLVEDFEDVIFGFGHFGLLDLGPEEFLLELRADDFLFFFIGKDLNLFSGVFLQP